MAKRVLRIVIDTNVLISAIIFGGKPREIIMLVLEEKLQAVTSSILLSELIDVLSKKFPLSPPYIQLIESEIKNRFKFVQPRKTISVLEDNDDNRVLEAGLEGRCDFIIIGDKDLLDFKNYKTIHILTPSEFINMMLTFR